MLTKFNIREKGKVKTGFGRRRREFTYFSNAREIEFFIFSIPENLND